MNKAEYYKHPLCALILDARRRHERKCQAEPDELCFVSFCLCGRGPDSVPRILHSGAGRAVAGASFPLIALKLIGCEKL